MPRYRKRPVIVEADQWFPAYVETLEGRHGVRPGDWIITGIKGERYPCRPDIFEATYEPVD